MELLWRNLMFWDREQALVCKRLDEDLKSYSKIKYIEANHRAWNEELLDNYYHYQEEYDFYNSEKQNKENSNAKYIRSLCKINMRNIIEEILKPVLEERKKYYEKNFQKELDRRWEILRQKLQKKFKRDDVVLPLIYTQNADTSQ